MFTAATGNDSVPRTEGMKRTEYDAHNNREGGIESVLLTTQMRAPGVDIGPYLTIQIPVVAFGLIFIWRQTE
ncbi:hypothetical protein Hypma_004738 [Hypsizygus marmoreus]|uniref:Uncharacterized protein n=1 Tax=Hypsizygus marmoreus TaxID=39966 RepID=A0A369J6I1_HYPMA|nr:hypothetical protein Hypma_004738 [Hypsizygus marmoreus]